MVNSGLACLYLKMNVAPQVLGVGRSNGACYSQKNILEVDSDSFWGHPEPLTFAHLLRTFFS